MPELQEVIRVNTHLRFRGPLMDYAGPTRTVPPVPGVLIYRLAYLPV